MAGVSLAAAGLQEDPDREVKAVVADNTIYKAAETFEDLGLSKELLQVGPRDCLACCGSVFHQLQAAALQ